MQYLIFIGSIISVLIITKILAWPIKKILKLLINIAVGLCLLVLVNYIGKSFNFNIPFNMVTAAITGLLGIPGIVLLIIFKIMGF